jgi:hypothetical protein
MKTKKKSYTKMSRAARREEAAKRSLTPDESGAVAKQKPGPLSLENVQRAVLEACGWKQEFAQEALLALVSKLKAKDDYAVIQASKLLLQLAGAFPSKQARVAERVEVVVSLKPFARVVESNILPPAAEDAEFTDKKG